MRDWFCGWYFKCQSPLQTLAIIPAYHTSKGEKSCSVQIITSEMSESVSFPPSAFRLCDGAIELAGNRFSRRGVELNLRTPSFSAVGSLSFGDFTPIRYDIMGPFRYVPFMQCRHSVWSMAHTVNGKLTVNGQPYLFCNATGYLEGDRGRSFPKQYAWTQCHFEQGSLMLSVADIPLCGYHFTGVIGVIVWRGREYRLATYLGAKAEKTQNGEIVIRQGKQRFTAKLSETAAKPLCAPIGGAMTRTIRENPACRASYCFEESGRIVFSFEASNAAFEYEYPQ